MKTVSRMKPKTSAMLAGMTTTLALAWLPLANPAQAQPVRSGNELPQALENIKPAAGICRRDDFASKPGATGLMATGPAAVDKACAITVQQVMPLQSDADSVLVDLRPAGDYGEFHIAGALNLGTSDLYAKPYWRRKKVVLIGSGKAEHELYRECSRLKQTGYSQVHVLHGGMTMWLHQGQPIAGRSPTAAQLADMARLSAQELWLESQNPGNLILLDRPRSAMQSEFSAARILEQASPASIRTAVDKQKKSTPKESLTSIVLIADLSDSMIEQIQRAVMPTPLLVYGDTPEAFAGQIATHKAIWAAQDRGPKQPACGS